MHSSAKVRWQLQGSRLANCLQIDSNALGERGHGEKKKVERHR